MTANSDFAPFAIACMLFVFLAVVCIFAVPLLDQALARRVYGKPVNDNDPQEARRV